MKSFEVEGISYRSISEFCRKKKVSYWKMVRLCRKYVRAQRDPAVAAKWILGYEEINFNREPKTNSFFRDAEMAKLRNIKNSKRQQLNCRRNLMKNIFSI